jgi:hypothetical protein
MKLSPALLMGNPMKLSSTLLALSPTLVIGACGDAPDPIVELTVIETIPVSFETMEGGVAESASVDLDDLRDEPAYADAVARLKCGALNVAKSSIEVEALDVGAGATVVDYRVSVATRGSTDFQPLVTFNSSVVEGDKVPFDNAKVAVDPLGLQKIAQTILSTSPALAVQVSATVPGALDDLQIAVKLALDFSSESGACPSATTGR